MEYDSSIEERNRIGKVAYNPSDRVLAATDAQVLSVQI